MPTKSKKRSLTTFILGSALTGIGSSLNSLKGSEIPDFLVQLSIHLKDNLSMSDYIFSYAGSTVLFAGIFFVLVSLFLWPLEKISSITPIILWRNRFKYIEIISGQKDLPQLYGYYHNLFGEDIVPIQQMNSWLEKNRDIVSIVKRFNRKEPETSETMIGFFDIEPLTASGETKLRRIDASAVQIRKSDIHSSRSAHLPTAYYVGSVGCPLNTPKFTQGICIVFLLKRLLEISNGRTIQIYTRPATDAGVYLVKELFKMNKRHRGPDKEVIWSKEINSKTWKPPEAYEKIAKKIGINMEVKT